MAVDKQKAYQEFMERFKQALIDNYDEYGLRASGKFEEGLKYKIKGDRLQMWAPFHSYFMESGRGAGFVHSSIIEDWIDNKTGLPSNFYENKKQVAFLIARKITREGINVPNQHNKGAVISSVVNEFMGDPLRELLDEVGITFLRRTDLFSDFYNIGKEAI